MLDHFTQIKQIATRDGQELSERDEKRIREILSDVTVVARNKERRKLKGRVQRKMAKAVLQRGRYDDNTQEDIELAPYDEMRVEIDTTYTSDKETVKNRARPSEVRALPRNYGIEIRGDGPLFAYQSSSNIINIVACDFNEISDFMGEED